MLMLCAAEAQGSAPCPGEVRVASFDVGIKNLAYCVMDMDGAREVLRIVAWDVADISGAREAAPRPQCGCAKSKAKGSAAQCARPASFEKAGALFCAPHANKSAEWRIRSREEGGAALQKLRLVELAAACAAAGMEFDPSARTSKGAMLAAAEAFFAARSFAPLVVERRAGAANVDLITAARGLARALDAEPALAGVDVVLIENQIGPLANRMKAVQGMITQYFVLRRPTAEIRYVSSGNKLKGLARPEGAREPGAAGAEGGAKRYAQHKADAIFHAREALLANPRLAPWAGGALEGKKADDYADCLLQALWWARVGILKGAS